MRIYDNTESEIDALKAETWQLDLLKLNPDYVSWGPYEDYMNAKSEGWSSPSFFNNWKDFSEWKLDDYNECVNFYFEVERESKNCTCENGYHEDAIEVVNGFYDYSSTSGIGWKSNITDDEYQMLLANGRIDKNKVDDCFVFLTKEEVNKQNERGSRGLGHDGINRYLLISQRLKRLSIQEKCEICDGKSYVYIKDKAHVNLILWMLHPRKGASRGVEVKNINKEDLENVFLFLKEAANRNAQRFSKII